MYQPINGNYDVQMEQDMRRYNPTMQVFRTNLKTGEGAEPLLEALLG